MHRRPIDEEAGPDDSRRDRRSERSRADRQRQQGATKGEPSDASDDKRRDEGVAIDERRKRRQRVAPLAQPADPQPHGDEGDGDRCQQGDPGPLGLAVHRIGGALPGNVARAAEALDGAALRFARGPRGIGFRRLPQMGFDLLGHAIREHGIVVEVAPKRGDIVVDQAGHVCPPFNSVSTACENRLHALRRSARADVPFLVSE